MSDYADAEYTPANDDNLLKASILKMGAALRHDLNNPLQEIVALTYIARTGVRREEALRALGEAADGLAARVNAIEERLLLAVESPSDSISPAYRSSVVFKHD